MKTYLKFFGTTTVRADRSYSILEEVKRAESHCVAGFSEKRAPHTFEIGDIIFMARMVRNPNDYIVFGQGKVADKFTTLRDRATVADTIRIPFREKWIYYLQLTETVFINGNLSKGVTIEQLIAKYKNNSFERTKDGQNWKLSIRQAFSNQSHIILTEVAAKWLTEEFMQKIQEFGKIEDKDLSQIPCPENAIKRR